MISVIRKKVRNRERLNTSEARWVLSEEPDIWELGKLAHEMRCMIHPPDRVTYQVDRNINYTNVCISQCSFCAFSRPPGHPESWTLSVDEIIQKVSETVDAGGDGILLQGGHNPDLPFNYYTDVLKAIRARFPLIHIHAFSPPEIVEFSKLYRKSAEQIMGKLIEAGLDSLPGGGAEILIEPTRKKICRKKCSGQEWLVTCRTAHKIGLKTTATMVIGFGESVDERLQHLLWIQDLQDETDGFTAFIPWTLQPANTSLEGKIEPLGGIEYLRLQAAARLILDNIPHHQVSWITQGLRVGSVALRFGADDFSSTMMEENVVSAAGASYKSNEAEVKRVIEAAGFKPVKRLSLYQNILHA